MGKRGLTVKGNGDFLPLEGNEISQDPFFRRGGNSLVNAVRYLVWGMVILLAVVGFLVGWVKYQEAYGLFYPTNYDERRLESLPEGIQYHRFESEKGRELTALLRNGSEDAPLMVLAHGNAGNMLDRLYWFDLAVPEDWSAMILDYGGFGRSEGRPSVPGLKEDVEAGIRYGLDETGADTLVLHGRSLGVPIAASAARHYPVEALILESGFPNAHAVAREILPVPGIGALLSTDLDTVDALKEARERHGPIPTFVIHGSRDRILPVGLGRSLHERIPEPKQWWLVEGAGHNNLPVAAGDQYRHRITKFLTETVPQSP